MSAAAMTQRRSPPRSRLVRGLLLAAAALWLAATLLPAAATPALQIGSKRFTESYILGEILRQTAAPYTPAVHRQGLGNTAIVFEALKAGNIDVYPEYSGTIGQEILHHRQPVPLAQINRELAPLGLGAAVPLGFNDSYALAMRADEARRLHIGTISDVAAHPSLRLGLSHEFLGRSDGWPGLARRYRLPQRPTGLDHGLAYRALEKGEVDVIDVYSTDAGIARYGLQVLDDDRQYFPRYDALLLYRLDLPQRFPQAWQALQRLQGRIPAAAMRRMNAAAEVDGIPFATIARNFLAQAPEPSSGRSRLWNKLFDGNLWRLTRQHLMLVLLSVAAASAIGIPLGVLAVRLPRLRQAVMATVGVLQTIPSLALLAMLIPLLGTIGALPALIALFLYALLPIVRNTAAGLEQVPAGLRMAALALGMTPRQQLLYVELPLALPVLLAGVKTATVMSVGTATIAAFIGAGGYGERIATGLALNDNDMLLAGAIPAAALALLMQLVFELAERRLRHRPQAC